MPRMLHNHHRLLSCANRRHLRWMLDRPLPAHRRKGSFDRRVLLPEKVDLTIYRFLSVLVSVASSRHTPWEFRRRLTFLLHTFEGDRRWTRPKCWCSKIIGVWDFPDIWHQIPTFLFHVRPEVAVVCLDMRIGLHGKGAEMTTSLECLERPCLVLLAGSILMRGRGALIEDCYIPGASSCGLGVCIQNKTP